MRKLEHVIAEHMNRHRGASPTLLRPKRPRVQNFTRNLFWPNVRLDPTQVQDQRAARYRDQLRGHDAPAAYNRSHSGSAKILDPGDYGSRGPNAGSGGDYGPYEQQDNPFGVRRRKRRR